MHSDSDFGEYHIIVVDCNRYNTCDRNFTIYFFCFLNNNRNNTPAEQR